MPTLKELLEQGEFKYGTDYRDIQVEKQSVSDFEQNGLRPNRLNLQANIYGAETLRITRQSTAILDDMRADTGGNQGLLGGILSQGTKLVNNFASKLGFPVLQIPTRVSDDGRLVRAIKGVGNDSIPEALAKIKGSGEGNILGKFLKQTAEGTPDQVGRRAVGNAINLAKSAAKNLLFGNGEPGQNDARNQTLSLRNEPIKYASAPRFQYSNRVKTSLDGGTVNERGLISILNDIQNEDPSLTGQNSFISKIKNKEATNFGDPYDGMLFPQFSADLITQNIPSRRDKTVQGENNFYTNPSNVPPFLRVNKPNGKFNTTYDTLTSSGSIWDSPDGTPPEFADGSTYDDLDFIPLRFYSVGKQKGVAFKATVSGITETFSPSWDTSNFIGNPYSFYTYQSINRKIDFSFSIYSLSSGEHKKNWEKIDFFSSLVYPQNTTNDVYVTPPLLKLTLGNMYKNKLGFIESLSYTIDDNTPWEIGLGVTKNGNRISDYDRNDLKDYKLPTIINVTISYQIIETSNDVVGKKLYPYGTSMIYGNQ
jgi:hypothetical protein